MVLYSALSIPLDRSKRFTLFAFPDRPVHSDTVLGFSWNHSSHAAIAQRLFIHMSTTVYSQVLMYTAESTEASWSERKCPNFETVTTGIRTRALSIASPAFYQLSYRAPHKQSTVQTDDDHINYKQYTLLTHFCLRGPAWIKLLSLSVAIKIALLLPTRIVKTLFRIRPSKI